MACDENWRFRALLSKQDRYLTVAEALQAAVASLLDEANVMGHSSFYYWAAFLPHGFASVQLEDALLDQMHERLMTLLQQESSTGCGEDGSQSNAMMALLTLTRDAYCGASGVTSRATDRQQTAGKELD